MTDNPVIIIYDGNAVFQRNCPECGRFVAPDETINLYGDGLVNESETNATCHKCGRVIMPFLGFY